MITTRRNNGYRIWQWNCRGYKSKRGVLHQYLNLLHHNSQPTPDVIALQETEVPAKLSGYKAYHSNAADTDAPQKQRVTTLLHRNIPAKQLYVNSPGPEYVFLEILPISSRQVKRLYILNVYSAPKQSRNLTQLLHQALHTSRGHPLAIFGDFNAPHPAWGYARPTKKGQKLWETIQELNLTLLTDPAHPTRRGNSVQQDTCSRRYVDKDL